LNKSTFIVKKGFIKYGETNGITPMKTHVDNVHLHLLIKRKSILNEKVVVKFSKIDQSQQHGKKRVGAIGIAITCSFGSTNMYKMLMTRNKDLSKTLCYTFAKATCFFQLVKTFG